MELNDIYIIDDVIPVQHQDYLSKFYTSSNIDWKFQKDITFHPTHNNYDNVEIFNPGFSNLMLTLGMQSLPLYHTAAPILYAACNKLNLEPLQVIKARSFLQLPIANQFNSINNPHIDTEIQHIVILYYITDSDGETIIYNETEESESYTIKETVKPKKGRCVVFNGNHYHSSSKPTNNVRATININIII